MTFRPVPLLANPHLQTILSLWVKGGRVPGQTRRHQLQLPDGDQLLLYENTPPAWQPGDPVALVLHGLTGSHLSGGVVLQARRLGERGIRVFRLDFRGAGNGIHFARGVYCAGSSADTRFALAEVARMSPGSPILLAGISLGGNVALKLAGELPEHPVPQLTRVAVLNPPIDLMACVIKLMKPSNRIYERHFLGELLKSARHRAKLYDEPPMAELPKPGRLIDFDNVYTAIRNGYSGVEEYYAKASSAQFVSRIPIPTYILTSRDDPFIAIEPFEALVPPANVTLRIMNLGGHTGFLGRDRHGGWGWAETEIAEWLTQGN